MAYTKVSVPKTPGNPGTPHPKNPNIIFIPVSAIESFPPIVSGEIVVKEDIKLKKDEKAIAIYGTPSTIGNSDSTDGDDDARGFVQRFEMYHPGREDDFEAFVESGINDDYVILALYPEGEKLGCRMLGTPSNPMKMQPEGQDDADAVRTNLVFEASLRSQYRARRYTGKIPDLAPTRAELDAEENQGPDQSA